MRECGAVASLMGARAGVVSRAVGAVPSNIIVD
jgi:hypothetical protein